MIKAIAACGNGMGSSLIIKMKIQEAFKELGIQASVDHMSVGEAKAACNGYDVVFVSTALESNFSAAKKTTIIGLRNLLSKDEIMSKIKESGLLSTAK